jgi:hypothetical protein
VRVLEDHQLFICCCASASAAFISSIDSCLAGSVELPARGLLLARDPKLWQPANEDRHNSNNAARRRMAQLIANRKSAPKIERQRRKHDPDHAICPWIGNSQAVAGKH